MNLNFSDPAVLGAIIQSAGAVVAAIFAAICAAVVGQQITGRKRMQEKLRQACADIAFLMAVEEAHCKLHAEGGGPTRKMMVRRQVIASGLAWSGRFTPGRVKAHGDGGFSMTRKLFEKLWQVIPSRRVSSAPQNALHSMCN